MRRLVILIFLVFFFLIVVVVVSRRRRRRFGMIGPRLSDEQKVGVVRTARHVAEESSKVGEARRTSAHELLGNGQVRVEVVELLRVAACRRRVWTLVEVRT